MANVKQTYRTPKATFRKEVASLLELVEGYDCVKVLPCLEVWKVPNIKGETPRTIKLNGKEIVQRNFFKLDAKITRQYKKLSEAYDKVLEENEFFKEDY